MQQFQGTDIEAYLKFITITTILHEAMHLLVYLTSGTTTPSDGDPDSGFRLEEEIFGGTIDTEICRVDVFRLAKIRGVLLQSCDNSPSKIIRECNRNLSCPVLFVHLYCSK